MFAVGLARAGNGSDTGAALDAGGEHGPHRSTYVGVADPHVRTAAVGDNNMVLVACSTRLLGSPQLGAAPTAAPGAG